VTDVAAPANEVPAEPDPNSVEITVNGRPFTARKGELIIAAVERAGVYIPRFCYHPRMDPVGMCRQCLVEVDTGRGPALMPSCMFPVAPEMKVDTESDTTKRAQEGVLELLLANHPLDCPVCDKGGECPLQDQAYTHGPGESRYVEAKRNFEKPIPISDHVLLDRERCILCDRCTRFADEVAGDKLIHFIHRGNLTQVNTFPDEPFASYFSGNVVQICPVGALTAKPYRFKARPWDLTEVDSTCTSCAVGCRISVHSSRDQLLRYQGLDTGEGSVNWGWLCDRGRFGFQAVESPDRLEAPLVRTGEGSTAESFTDTTWGAALTIAKQLVEQAGTIGLLGGARSSNEGALAWARLADAIGVEYRDAQLGDGLPAGVLSLPRATIDEAAAAATVVLLGPDLKEELPILYLRLRDAAQRKHTRIVELTARESGLSRYAWRSVRLLPGSGGGEIAKALADPEIADQLRSGDVVVIAGRGNLAESEAAAVTSLRAVLDAAPGARVLPALRRGNVVGALQLGLAPTGPGRDGLATLRLAADGKLDLLVLLGADPINDCPDADLARRALAGARRVIAIDTFLNDSSRHADLVLAAAAFGEQDGTTTNLEGRVSPLTKSVTARGTSRPDWMIAAELALMLGRDIGFDSVESAIAATAAVTPPRFPELPAGLAPDAPPNSYDYRLVVSRKLYDRAVGTAKSPALAPLAPGAAAHLHPLDLERVGVPEGTEVKLVGARGSVVLPLVADAAVQRGTVWAPFNQDGADITELVDSASATTDLRIERL
jgi:NADH-quinone oxidoreductase subunit G